MWLTRYDTCDSWTHGGHKYFSLQDLSQWIGIHEGMIILDLHEGLNPKDGCRDPLPRARS
jgi:hypothetical protein